MNTEIAIYGVLVISLISLILSIVALKKLKLLVYLFEQPVVKKLGSKILCILPCCEYFKENPSDVR